MSGASARSACPLSESAGNGLLRPHLRTRHWLLGSSPPAPSTHPRSSRRHVSSPGAQLTWHRPETRPEWSLPPSRMPLPQPSTAPHPYLVGSVCSLGTWFLDLTDYTSGCPDPCPQGKHGLGVLGALSYCCHRGLDPCPIAHACSELRMPPAHLPGPEDGPPWGLWSSCPFLLMEILSLFPRPA